MSDMLSALRLFVRVAATGSFSQAAREQNLSQPTASRIIARLADKKSEIAPDRQVTPAQHDAVKANRYADYRQGALAT